MKKKINITILLLITGVICFAQNDTNLAPLRKIKEDIVAFTVDNLDNIYLLNSSDQLKKLDAKGDSVTVFNNVRRYGKVYYIDASNPMRILLYYKNFTTIVMLDNMLNNRNTIDLRQQNIYQVQAIGLSYDNKIWIYDEFEHKLKKIDEDGKLLFSTSDFRQLFNEAFNFSSIYDEGGLVYLYDKNKGVLVFDYYGSLKNRIPFTGCDNFKVVGKYIFGTRNDSLLRYQPSVFLSQQVALPPAFRKADAINFTSTKAYALKNDELEIYRLR